MPQRADECLGSEMTASIAVDDATWDIAAPGDRVLDRVDGRLAFMRSLIE